MLNANDMNSNRMDTATRQLTDAVVARRQPPLQKASPPLQERRFEAARTNRLNKHHWSRVRDQEINADLLNDQKTLRDRCKAEYARNPTIQGIVETMGSDIVGENGPRLQVKSPDRDFNAAVEKVWKKVWDDLDAGGRAGGADLLGLSVVQLWESGEILGQMVVEPDAETAVKTRMRMIDPRRLNGPAGLAASDRMFMGIEVSDTGRPVKYYIDRYVWQAGGAMTRGINPDEIPARDVIHVFGVVEAEQYRGVPWMAVGLTEIADLRQYDAEVLQAAIQAANQAVYWYTEHQDAEYVEVNESIPLERGTQSTAPPGWKPAMLNPTQPATNYKEYRNERKRDIGRCKNIPLMMVNLDSSNHNYSSARFDNQIYVRGLKKIRHWLGRRMLNRILNRVVEELVLLAGTRQLTDLLTSQQIAAIRRMNMGEVEFQWLWPSFPHVDPAKEANGETLRLENGTVTYAQLVAEHGLDEDEVLDSRAQTLEKFKERGLPVPAWLLGDSADAAAVQQVLDANDQLDAVGADGKPLPKGKSPSSVVSGQSIANASTAGKNQTPTGTVGLNGAQITAAVDVLTKLSEQKLSTESAKVLLVAAGIPEADADKAVASQKIGQDASSDDTAFKRDVLKAFLNDGTTNDVIYNLVDIEDLIVQTGLTPEANAQAPWLPVVTESGPIATGEPIVDDEGDVVGGEVEQPEQPEPSSFGKQPFGNAAPPSPASDGEADGEDDSQEQKA